MIAEDYQYQSCLGAFNYVPVNNARLAGDAWRNIESMAGQCELVDTLNVAALNALGAIIYPNIRLDTDTS